MIVKVSKSRISGSVVIPSSKSEMHRALICAALGDSAKTILGDLSGDDVLVTKRCLEALGSNITIKDNTIIVTPINRNIKEVSMNAESSGSTLRFMLCICAMLGITVNMDGSARLRERPLDDLIDTLSKNGPCARCRNFRAAVPSGVRSWRRGDSARRRRGAVPGGSRSGAAGAVSRRWRRRFFLRSSGAAGRALLRRCVRRARAVRGRVRSRA